MSDSLLHEAERDEVDAERHAERKIGAIPRGQRRCCERHARGVDALVLAERAAVHDHGIDATRVHGDDLQLDPPVIEQKTIPRLHGLRKASECGEDPGRGLLLRFPFRCGADHRSASNSGPPPSSRPVRIFGPLKILQDGHGPARAAAGRADQSGHACVLFVGPVRKVQPKEVDARRNQAVDHRLGRARRPDSCDDLGVTRHPGFSLQSERP